MADTDQDRDADHRRQDLRTADLLADRRPRCDRHPQALWPGRRLHLRSGLHLDRRLRQHHHLHRRRQGRAAASRLSDRPAGGKVALSRGLLPAALRRTADRRASWRNSRRTITRHTMLHEQMQYFFRGFRRDAHPMATMVGVVGAMAAFYHDSTDINDPRQREIASHRLMAKMPTIAAMGLQVFDRPAVRLSAQRPRLRGELPAHVLCRAGRAIPCRSDPRPRDGPDLHPACRSRAERLDLDRASGLVLGGQPLRLHRGRHRLPLGARPWRREPGLPRDAQARSAPPTASPNTSRAPRTRTIRSA